MKRTGTAISSVAVRTRLRLVIGETPYEQPSPQGISSWAVPSSPCQGQGDEGRELHDVCRTLPTLHPGPPKHKGAVGTPSCRGFKGNSANPRCRRMAPRNGLLSVAIGSAE